MSYSIGLGLGAGLGLGWSLGASGPSVPVISGISATTSYLSYGYNMVANGDYFYTANSANNRITGEISIVIDSALDDWTPTNPNIFVAKDETTAGTRSYSYNCNASYPHFNFSVDGTNLIGYAANAALPFTNGQRYHHGVYRNPTTGEIKFFYSLDSGVTWTQLGTTITGTTGNIYAGTAQLSFGNRSSLSYLLAGKIYDSEIYTGNVFEAPGSAVLKVDFDPVDWRSGDNWEAVDTGEIWYAGANAKVARLYQLTFNFTSSIAGIARVEYGTASGVYPWVANDSTVATTHSITVGSAGGLDDKRAYYYRVGISVDGGSTWTYSADQQILPPAPVAVILSDAMTIPSLYTANNGYFPTTSATTGFTGITTYEGYQGHGVTFCGYNSTGAIVEHLWDFGAGTESDYGGRYFRGMNAGHVFEAAGTYTVTLTVTDYLGRTSSATKTVTIHAAGAGNTSIYGSYALTTFYVDDVSGNDTYNGKAQTFDGTNGPWKTFEKVIATLQKTSGSAASTWTIKAGDKVLLKRGGTFTTSLMKSIAHGGISAGVYIGAYGTGAKPRVIPDATGVAAWAPSTAYAVGDRYITPSANGTVFMTVSGAYTSGTTYGSLDQTNTFSAYFKFGLGGQFLTFVDIEFDFYNASYNTAGIMTASGNIRNIAFLRCSMKDSYNNPINCDQDPGSFVDLYKEPYGIFIIGCDADQSRTYSTHVVCLFYGSPGSFVMIGNTIDNGGNHLVYIMRLTQAIIADNVFSRPAFGRTALRIDGGVSGFVGKRIHITRNKFLGWIDPISNATGAHNGGGTSYNYTLLNLSPNNAANLYIEDVVFDRNIVTNYESGLTVANVHRARVCNNIFSTPSPKGRALLIGENKSQTSHTANDDVDVYNNTFVNTGGTGGLTDASIAYFESYTLGTIGINLKFRNNLAISVSGRDDNLLGFQRTEQVANVASDNNLYQTVGADFAKVVSTALTKAGWTSTYSKDVNSIVGSAGVVTPPTPVTHTPGNPSSSAACVAEADAYIAAFRLAAGSSAINAGDDLVYRYTDFDGNPAPVGAHPDIGAFEYQ